jgi:uncharacterized membrane protein YfcA
MSHETILILLVIGLLAGFLSSMVGIGGGLVIVPALVLFLGMEQKAAQGTSLLIIALPVTAAGAYAYYKGGNLDWRPAMVVAATFLIGGYLGGLVAQKTDPWLIRKLFALLLIYVAIKFLFFDKPKPKNNQPELPSIEKPQH